MTLFSTSVQSEDVRSLVYFPATATNTQVKAAVYFDWRLDVCIGSLECAWKWMPFASWILQTTNLHCRGFSSATPPLIPLVTTGTTNDDPAVLWCQSIKHSNRPVLVSEWKGKNLKGSGRVSPDKGRCRYVYIIVRRWRDLTKTTNLGWRVPKIIGQLSLGGGDMEEAKDQRLR